VAGDAARPAALIAFLSTLSPRDDLAVALVASGEGAQAALDLARAHAPKGVGLERAVDGVELLAGRIYIIPDAIAATVIDDRFLLAPTSPADGRVDTLFLSVAEAFRERAVLVVMAGLGADGAAGFSASKSLGGFSLAERAVEAVAESEPGTAADVADLVAPPGEMNGHIAAYLNGVTRRGDGASAARGDTQLASDEAVARIVSILRHVTGNDFHGYKRATFLRRIERRMQVAGLDDVERYIERLREDKVEVRHLFQDLLIGVTQFFRDADEFAFLETHVMPRLFEGKGPEDRLRVWVLGCASGEEAYSLAILLREQMERLDICPPVQVFATDIDARALAVARAGRYPESILRDVAPARLARWFVKEGATYRVAKELREMCIFSPHNLVRDAPFSRIDLISCRNLLIYLNSDLQDRVIPIFHFSLRPEGYLFLGPAENVTRRHRLFAPLDRKRRIFRRLDAGSRALPSLPLSTLASGLQPGRGSGASATSPLDGDFGRRVEQIVERYAPAFVVVDRNHEVLNFSGRTGRFLEPASGTASLNLLSLAHRDLRLDLRTALHKAAAQSGREEARNIRMNLNGEVRAVNIVVEPVGGDDAMTQIVIFQDVGPGLDDGWAGDPARAHDEHVQRLDAELRLTKERLQTTIEELEGTNEELKSSNEEYQSINEELQSANEELETSKEELQAVNEELQTVNGELAHRVSELARANSDLNNLLESTQIATIFLDNELRLRRFTPAATDIFNLIESDVGRPISDLSPRIRYPELQADARRVLRTLRPVEREAAGDEDRTFLVRVLPYRSIDNFIAGVVVAFLDVTGAVRAEAALRVSERRFGEAQELADVGVWEWNSDSDQLWWSPVVYRLWGETVADGPPPLSERRVLDEDRADYGAALAGARASGALDVEYRVVRPDGAIRWLAERGRRSRVDGAGGHMLGVVQDITERKQTEGRQNLLLGELQHRVRNILGVVRSIVAQTVRTSDGLEALAAHLDGRLQSLARVQNVFTRSAEASVDLEEIVRDELLSVGAREDRVSISGPTVRLRREAAETLALAVHELTTNAVKYGALALDRGRLTVEWRIMNASDGPRLSLDWREEDVRLLDTQPARYGFGRELLERGLPYELGATTHLEFLPGGIRARIELPVSGKVEVVQARFDTEPLGDIDGSGAE